jgi:hypothetical protein
MSWTGSVKISPQGIMGSEQYTIEIYVDADSKEEAQKGAERVLNFVASGKKTFIRVRPDGDSFTDFDTKIVLHRGYARATVVTTPGTWEDSQFCITRLPFTEVEAKE